jgi:hypothetical protein
MILTITATLSTEGANMVKNLAIIMKRGAPGGCPISNLYEVEMNSAQSHRLAVGSIVKKYVTADIAKAIQPNIRLYLLK